MRMPLLPHVLSAGSSMAMSKQQEASLANSVLVIIPVIRVMVHLPRLERLKRNAVYHREVAKDDVDQALLCHGVTSLYECAKPQ
jgi:hypothetical protein